MEHHLARFPSTNTTLTVPTSIASMPSLLGSELSTGLTHSSCLSMFLHCNPAVGKLRKSSCLCSFLCHCINLMFALLLNKRFKHDIIGKYHITLPGTPFLVGSPSTSLGSSRLILYCYLLQIGQVSRFSYSSHVEHDETVGVYLYLLCLQS